MIYLQIILTLLGGGAMEADNWGRVHSCVLNPGTDQHRVSTDVLQTCIHLVL